MMVKHREYANPLVGCRKEHRVREIADQRSPRPSPCLGKLQGILDQSRENGTDPGLKAEAKPGTLAFVSKRRLEHLEFGLGRDIEAPHLRSRTEAGEEFLADLGPRPKSGFAATIRRKALCQDTTVPLRHRDLLGMLREMLPERLDVLQLFFGGEFLEAGWRKSGLRHAFEYTARADTTPREAVPRSWAAVPRMSR